MEFFRIENMQKFEGKLLYFDFELFYIEEKLIRRNHQERNGTDLAVYVFNVGNDLCYGFRSIFGAVLQVSVDF